MAHGRAPDSWLITARIRSGWTPDSFELSPTSLSSCSAGKGSQGGRTKDGKSIQGTGKKDAAGGVGRPVRESSCWVGEKRGVASEPAMAGGAVFFGGSRTGCAHP